MTGRTPGPAFLRVAAAALLALAVALPGCGRPADEQWLRVVSVKNADGEVVTSVSSVLQTSSTESTTTTTTTTSSTETTTESTEETTTSSGSPDYVTMVFVNQSTIPGSDEEAAGVTIDRVQISYRAAGYTLPDASFAVTLYVPADASEVGLALPLVSAELKSWLMSHVPTSVLERGLAASARLTVHATTDEGGEVETAASVGIEFVIEATRTTTTSTSTTE